MTADIAKPGVDLGIVISDSEKSLAFYVGVLGLDHEGDIPMPIGGGGTMHRVRCGDSLIKLVSFVENPPAAVGGGIPGALGFRYLTIAVSNINELVEECSAAGVTVVVPVNELRPGITIAIVEDPDGNWVEFIQNA